MKNKSLIIILGLLSLPSLTKAAGSPVTGSVFISEKRDAAVTSFKNTSSKQVYCEQLQFKFKVVGDEFGEDIGEFSESLKSLYLEPDQEVTTNLAKDLKKFSRPNRVAILSEATPDFSQCREVKFVDYCNFAPKGSDELYTLQRILAAAGTGRCEDVETNLKGKLKLKEAGIFNVKPISYLTGIKELNLARNNITSVVDLSTLTQLEKIDLSKNPLKEIDAVVALPNIETIDASYTNLTYKKWEKVSSRLKKVYAYGTPYSDVKGTK